jgi:hypothetical protein
MGIRVETDETQEMELATLQSSSLHLRIYWNKKTKMIRVRHSSTGEDRIRPDGLLRDCLSSFLPIPFALLSCRLYESDGTPSLPFNVPDDILDCEWSDFACDGLFLAITIAD